jgi:hypothetical protein
MAGYLIQTGNTRLLDTLEVLLSALLASAGTRREAGTLMAAAGGAESQAMP